MELCVDMRIAIADSFVLKIQTSFLGRRPEGTTTMENQIGWWLPVNISAHGAGIDQLINVVHVFMLVLFIGWGAFFVFCLVRFRSRSGHKAETQVKHFKVPMYLEIGILLFEIFLLVFLSSPIWYEVKTAFPAEKDALVVNILAEQFAWNIHYPGKDGKFGTTKPELMDGTNPIGLDRASEGGADDIFTINNLHIPVNKPVIVHLQSKDVIHSFFLPVMRVKQDAIPGQSIPLWFQATQTGEFEIACAQLCGIGHYRMRGQFFVDTPENFDKFIAEETATLTGETTEGVVNPAVDAAPSAPAPEASAQPEGSHHE